MADYKETAAKKTIRELLKYSCEKLQRPHLTYLGLPADDAADLRALSPLLENAICIEREKKVLVEMRRNVSLFPLKIVKCVHADMWEYLRDDYRKEPLLADVTFLDFYGGGIMKDDPFQHEIAGLRNYFSRHASVADRAFAFAWTYMPRDKGKEAYVSALRNFIEPKLLAQLEASSGVWARSIAIRLLLWQSLREHKMRCLVVQHAVYKRVMNAIILVFANGTDPRCPDLEDNTSILKAAACVYEADAGVPKLVNFIN